MGPNFVQITKKRKLIPQEVFKVPERIAFFRHQGPVRPTHLIVKNHNWGFAYTDNPLFWKEFYKSSNKNRFFPIPWQAAEGQFAEAVLDENHYGNPKWFSGQGEEI